MSNKKFAILLLTVLIIFIITFGFFLSNKRMHLEVGHITDLTRYSYKKFYNLMREDRLALEIELEKLNQNPLSVNDKKRLTKICSFYVDDGMERILVAKGHDCLLRLYSDNSATLVEKYKALKDGSRGLEVLYTQTAALNLAKLIIAGYEEEIKALLKQDKLELLEYFTGYSKDEVPFLEKLLSLNIAELTARCLYRLSLIHIFGRSSFNEEIINPNYAKAIEEIQNVIKISNIKQDNELDIALIINDKFAEHAAVVISSSLLNSDLNSFYKFHIIMSPQDQLSEESKTKLASMQFIRNYSIDFINFPEGVINEILEQQKLKFSETWPLLVIYRLYLDKIFPNLNSILYLDADITVLQDLTSLKKIDMTDYIIAGALDDGLNHCILKVNTDCNLSIKNAGVIFFNFKNIRSQNTSHLLSSTLEQSKCNFAFLDQDLLNLTFSNHTYPLSRRWNAMSHFYSDETNYLPNYIIHYAGSLKPWRDKVKKLWQTNPEKLNEHMKNYWRYRNLTPWQNNFN